MKLIPIPSRSWCDLAECPRSTIPQDCILFGSVVVCKSCLIDLGGGGNAADILSQIAQSLDKHGEPELANRIRESRAALKVVI